MQRESNTEKMSVDTSDLVLDAAGVFPRLRPEPTIGPRGRDELQIIKESAGHYKAVKGPQTMWKLKYAAL